MYDQIKSKIGAEFEFLGEQSLKNIPEPVRVYRVEMEAKDSSKVAKVRKIY